MVAVYIFKGDKHPRSCVFRTATHQLGNRAVMEPSKGHSIPMFTWILQKLIINYHFHFMLNESYLRLTFTQNEKNNPLMIMKRHLVYNRPSIAVLFLTFQKRVINPLLKLKTIEYFLKKIEKISFENLHYDCDFFNCENSSDCLTLLKIEYSL